MDQRERRQAIQEHLAKNRAALGDDIPAGYEPAERMDDSLFALLCLDCGATVSRRMAGTHSEWHQRLYRLGQS